MKRVPVALLVVVVLAAACLVEALTPACWHGMACLGAQQAGGVMLALDATGVALAGMAVVAGRIAWTRRRVDRTLHAIRQPAPPRVTALRDRLGLAEVALLRTDTPTAFCAGFARPCVYVSDGLLARLTEAELTAVLAHEAAHARRHDPLRLAIASFIGDLCFAVPLVTRWRRSVLQHAELRADTAAVTATSRSAVASALRALDGAPTADRGVGAARNDQLLGATHTHERPRVRELGLSIAGVLAVTLPLLCIAQTLLLTLRGQSLL